MNEIAESFDVFMEQTRREKEDRQMSRLRHPKEMYSKEISKLINDTQKSGNKVYLMCDLHLWMYDKNTHKIHRRSDYNSIMANIKRTVNENDMLINLGDLVDGEFRSQRELKDAISEMPGKYKVLVRGNNDLFDTRFYKQCGFDYVTDAFSWNSILFTHAPVDNRYQYNVHSHLHNSKTYWIQYRNHIDVAWLDGRKKPVEIMEPIKKQKQYSRLVTVDRHGYEKQKKITNEFFESILSTDSVFTEFVHDPFDDDGNEVFIQEAAYKNRKLLLTSTGFDNHHIRDVFINNLGKSTANAQVLFVPTAANTKEAKDILPACRQELIDAGIRAQNITTYNLDSRMSYEKLSDYDVIYFAGGSEKVLMNAILKVGFKTALKRCINEGLFFIGVSAGAMIATGSVENNLGIIKNPLSPHCKASTTPCGKIINGTSKINISDNQAVWIHGNIIEIIE